MEITLQNNIHRPYTVLILFGANLVSYNIASALHGQSYQTIAFAPSNTRLIFKKSTKFHQIGMSKYHWNDDGYTEELPEFIKPYLSEKYKILTYLVNDEVINFWIKNQDQLLQYCDILTQYCPVKSRII